MRVHYVPDLSIEYTATVDKNRIIVPVDLYHQYETRSRSLLKIVLSDLYPDDHIVLSVEDRPVMHLTGYEDREQMNEAVDALPPEMVVPGLYIARKKHLVMAAPLDYHLMQVPSIHYCELTTRDRRMTLGTRVMDELGFPQQVLLRSNKQYVELLPV